MNFCLAEWSPRHLFFVEGDVYGVIEAFERNKADGKPCRTQWVDLGGNVASPGGDGDLQVALAGLGGVDGKLDWLSDGSPWHRGHQYFGGVVGLASEWRPAHRHVVVVDGDDVGAYFLGQKLGQEPVLDVSRHLDGQVGLGASHRHSQLRVVRAVDVNLEGRLLVHREQLKVMESHRHLA